MSAIWIFIRARCEVWLFNGRSIGNSLGLVLGFGKVTLALLVCGLDALFSTRSFSKDMALNVISLSLFYRTEELVFIEVFGFSACWLPDLTG